MKRPLVPVLDTLDVTIMDMDLRRIVDRDTRAFLGTTLPLMSRMSALPTPLLEAPVSQPNRKARRAARGR